MDRHLGRHAVQPSLHFSTGIAIAFARDRPFANGLRERDASPARQVAPYSAATMRD
jgi:hypothetical protein